MSSMAILTLQNAADLPSPVTLHFDDPNTFNLRCPHSPTSSLKGVFVRSRPSSMDLSELADLPSEFGQFGMTGNTRARVPFLHASPAPMHTITSALDTPATAPTRVRAVRRLFVDHDHDSDSDADADADADVPPTEPAPTPRRRTWPSMGNLRGRVSGIFQRRQSIVTHGPGSVAPPPSPTASSSTASASAFTSFPCASTTALAPAPVRRVFSFSLRSRTTKHAAPVKMRATTERGARRRSRSFSGFTSMAHQVLAPIAEPAHDDDYEGGEVWIYALDEDEEEAAAAALLERGVE
ncbi:hypothetical protein C8R44DRAFT_736335 [Mycena epipterygia]|nr:hypothetical protein C8R44DRAFT_736335 [Mycena epipterygia]